MKMAVFIWDICKTIKDMVEENFYLAMVHSIKVTGKMISRSDLED